MPGACTLKYVYVHLCGFTFYGYHLVCVRARVCVRFWGCYRTFFLLLIKFHSKKKRFRTRIQNIRVENDSNRIFGDIFFIIYVCMYVFIELEVVGLMFRSLSFKKCYKIKRNKKPRFEFYPVQSLKFQQQQNGLISWNRSTFDLEQWMHEWGGTFTEQMNKWILLNSFFLFY